MLQLLPILASDCAPSANQTIRSPNSYFLKWYRPYSLEQQRQLLEQPPVLQTTQTAQSAPAAPSAPAAETKVLLPSDSATAPAIAPATLRPTAAPTTTTFLSKKGWRSSSNGSNSAAVAAEPPSASDSAGNGSAASEDKPKSSYGSKLRTLPTAQPKHLGTGRRSAGRGKESAATATATATATAPAAGVATTPPHSSRTLSQSQQPLRSNSALIFSFEYFDYHLGVFRLYKQRRLLGQVAAVAARTGTELEKQSPGRRGSRSKRGLSCSCK